MADEDWDDGSSAAVTTNDTQKQSIDSNNNEPGETKPGFRGFGGSNKDENGGGGGNRAFGGFGKRNDDNNEGGGSRGGFGGGGRGGGFGGRPRGGGFGGGGGFGNRKNDDENGGGGDDGGNRGGRGGFSGGFRRNNDENGGENRRFGGGGGGFGRRNNDENGEGGNRGGFGGGGGGFRRNNDENGEGGNRGGFGGGGFRRNNDGESRGGFSGGGGFRRNNDENGGGERKSFGRRNDENGENGGSGGRGGFGGGGGGFGRRNNDENGEGGNRGGFGGGGGFGRRNNDENGGGGGGGFRKPRDGDSGDNNRGGGFGGGGFGGGGFKRRDGDGDGDNGGRGGGFGGGGFRKRDDNDGNSRGGFGGSRGGDRDRSGGRGGGGGGGGFGNRDRSAPNRRDDNNNEDKAGGDGAPKERYIPPAIEDDEKIFDHTIATGVNFRKQAEIPATLSGEDSDKIEAIKSFKEAGLSDLLLENIEKSRYEIPTPVQKYAIPIILQKRDLMACAQTGSGKTAAYLIPILTNILHDGIESSELSTTQTPQALILSPTRELAIQIFSECKKFSYKSIIKSQILYGGTVTGYQMSEIAKGTNILVATPGRLLDVIKRGGISLEKVKYIVLDEADRMLDFGFEATVRDILSKCSMEKSLRNIFMFSATFPKEIQQLAQDFLQNYLFLTIGVVGGANTDVDQVLHKVEDNFKKREQLVEILNEIGSERTMIFVEQKKQADVLAFFLLQKGYPTTSIHGDRLQSQRESALRDFKQGDSKIIVCTSVAARGLDISDVKYVINYDLPQTIDEYVHRIGRTGRCGNLGKSISFFSNDSENDRKLARNLVRILTQASKDVPQWLNDAAEDCMGGGGVAATTHTRDIRKIDKNFRSIAINDDESTARASTSGGASAAEGGDDEKWE